MASTALESKPTSAEKLPGNTPPQKQAELTREVRSGEVENILDQAIQLEEWQPLIPGIARCILYRQPCPDYFNIEEFQTAVGNFIILLFLDPHPTNEQLDLVIQQWKTLITQEQNSVPGDGRMFTLFKEISPYFMALAALEHPKEPEETKATARKCLEEGRKKLQIDYHEDHHY